MDPEAIFSDRLIPNLAFSKIMRREGLAKMKIGIFQGSAVNALSIKQKIPIQRAYKDELPMTDTDSHQTWQAGLPSPKRQNRSLTRTSHEYNKYKRTRNPFLPIPTTYQPTKDNLKEKTLEKFPRTSNPIPTQEITATLPVLIFFSPPQSRPSPSLPWVQDRSYKHKNKFPTLPYPVHIVSLAQ